MNMARPEIALPSTFDFSTEIPVRITDVNYGGHVGNDTILSIIHEARMQFLAHFGYSEIKFGGAGMIMRDVSINFRNELFYGDIVHVSVAIKDVSNASFNLVYLLQKQAEGKNIIVAHANTGMVCFDYERRKITAVPEEVKKRLNV